MCLPQERGMGHIHRSHRRLLTRANSHPVSKIPQVSFQRRHLPVHQPPLRASNSPPHFHQYSQRGKTDGFAIRNRTPPIPGRLVDPCPLRTTMHGPNTKSTKAGEGFGLYSKPQEVRTQTISEVRLPGLPLFTRFGSCEAHARQVDQTSGDVPSPLLEVCYQCKDSYVHHWIACINGEDCKIGQDAYETFSVASQNSLEISDASGHTGPLESEDDTTRGMVVRPSKCATRRTSPPQGTRKTNIYRRLKRRLGSSLRSKLYRRALVSLRKAPSHQPIRNEGGSSGSAILQGTGTIKSSDNTSVVAYINKLGGTKLAELCALMWRILTWCRLNNVTLRARHVPGSLNVIADGLSRRNQIQSTEWSLSPQVFKQISKLWESPQVDLFATSLNKKLPTYVSPIPDPQAWAVDDLNIPWDNLVAYAFPPTALLPKVVQKLQSQTCRIILIAPDWRTKPWFWDLVEMSLDIPRQLPPTCTLLKQPLNNHYHANPTSLNLHAWYLEFSTPRTWFHCRSGRKNCCSSETLNKIHLHIQVDRFPTLVHRKTGGLQESLYRRHLQLLLVSVQ